jgi:hypothetical protein
MPTGEHGSYDKIVTMVLHSVPRDELELTAGLPRKPTVDVLARDAATAAPSTRQPRAAATGPEPTPPLWQRCATAMWDLAVSEGKTFAQVCREHPELNDAYSAKREH